MTPNVTNRDHISISYEISGPIAILCHDKLPPKNLRRSESERGLWLARPNRARIDRTVGRKECIDFAICHAFATFGGHGCGRRGDLCPGTVMPVGKLHGVPVLPGREWPNVSITVRLVARQ